MQYGVSPMVGIKPHTFAWKTVMLLLIPSDATAICGWGSRGSQSALFSQAGLDGLPSSLSFSIMLTSTAVF